MIILALDTTTRAGSAAVVRHGEVVAELVGDAAITHGQRLPADLMRVLEYADLAIADVELVAVAAGPGSFTGLRVGIATAQGLAMAHGRKVAPVSTLEALAWGGAGSEEPRGAWMDAQRGEVFAALYGSRGRTLAAPTSAAPEATLNAWRNIVDLSRVTFIGDGAVRYAHAITREAGAFARIVPPTPLAGVVGRIAFEQPQRAVVPHAITPIYIRRSDAELARLRRAAPGTHG